MAIDSKLRACSRAMIIQQKTGIFVQFEITEQTRKSIETWYAKAHLKFDDYLFPSHNTNSPCITIRQYAGNAKPRFTLIELDPYTYGTHSLRRTKATLIYRRTKNFRAIQLLLGHTKMESMVQYLGIEVDGTLEMAEHTEV